MICILAYIDEAKAQLKSQLEFYFSKSNLLSDKFLVSRMDAQGYVSIALLASFPKVKAITENEEDLIAIIRECKGLELDLEARRVRPQREPRTTIIVRELPTDTTEEELRAVFTEDRLVHVRSIKPDPLTNTLWYIQFDEEQVCSDTALWLMTQNFREKPIKCRVKPATPYLFSPPPPSAFPYPQQGAGTPSVGASAGWGQGPVSGASAAAAVPTVNGFYPVASGFSYGYAHPQMDPNAPMGGKGRKNIPGMIHPGGRHHAGHHPHHQKPRGGPRDFENKYDPETHSNGVVGYPGPYISYTREEMAKVVEELAKTDFEPPASFPKVTKDGVSTPLFAGEAEGKSPSAQAAAAAIVRPTPRKTHSLLTPIPVMYPASPSPQAVGMPATGANIPFFDLSGATPAMLPGQPYAGVFPGFPNLANGPMMSHETFNPNLAANGAAGAAPGQGKPHGRRHGQQGQQQGQQAQSQQQQGQQQQAQQGQQQQGRRAQSGDSAAQAQGQQQGGRKQGGNRNRGKSSRPEVPTPALEVSSVAAPTLPTGSRNFAQMAAAAPSAESVAQVQAIARENAARKAAAAAAAAAAQQNAGTASAQPAKRTEEKENGNNKQQQQRKAKGEQQGKKDEQSQQQQKKAAEGKGEGSRRNGKGQSEGKRGGNNTSSGTSSAGAAATSSTSAAPAAPPKTSWAQKLKAAQDEGAHAQAPAAATNVNSASAAPAASAAASAVKAE